jgi:hypothetical protein
MKQTPWNVLTLLTLVAVLPCSAVHFAPGFRPRRFAVTGIRGAALLRPSFAVFAVRLPGGRPRRTMAVAPLAAARRSALGTS